MTKVLKPYSPKPLYRPRAIKHEETLQKQICSYLRLQYPNIIFRSDYASGIKLTMNQAVQHKRLQSSRAWPDLFIYEPMKRAGKQYAGLALELKKDGTSVILKVGTHKGQLSSNPHIQEQALMLKELTRKGYYADFAVGYDAAVGIIDWYLNNTPPENAELF
jgi:hypothetical protein